jgi:hypothetical protein
MLAYNLFAKAHSMQTVETLDSKCSQVYETTFDGDAIDELLDTTVPVEEDQYNIYRFVFANGSVSFCDLEEYLKFDIKKHTLANKLFGIPKAWID